MLFLLLIPTILTLNTMAKDRREEMLSWLIYWIVISVTISTEIIISRLSLLDRRYLSLVTTVFLVWVIIPGEHGGGALIVYQQVLLPFHHQTHNTIIQSYNTILDSINIVKTDVLTTVHEMAIISSQEISTGWYVIHRIIHDCIQYMSSTVSCMKEIVTELWNLLKLIIETMSEQIIKKIETYLTMTIEMLFVCLETSADIAERLVQYYENNERNPRLFSQLYKENSILVKQKILSELHEISSITTKNIDIVLSFIKKDIYNLIIEYMLIKEGDIMTNSIIILKDIWTSVENIYYELFFPTISYMQIIAQILMKIILDIFSNICQLFSSLSKNVINYYNNNNSNPRLFSDLYKETLQDITEEMSKIQVSFTNTSDFILSTMKHLIQENIYVMKMYILKMSKCSVILLSTYSRSIKNVLLVMLENTGIEMMKYFDILKESCINLIKVFLNMLTTIFYMIYAKIVGLFLEFYQTIQFIAEYCRMNVT